MLGANESKGEFIYFLNNDCILLNDAIYKMFKLLKLNREISALVPKLFSIYNIKTSSF